MQKISYMEPWYDEKEINAISQYLKDGYWITEHVKTKELEKIIADYTGAEHCLILPNGTLTLWAALAVLDIGLGDEVIVPDFTMVATPNAVCLAGAKPVFVDVDPKDICLDFEKTKQAITEKTKAVMLVSINGRCPNIEKFVTLAKEKNLYLIEDSAQSLGSKVNGKHLGTFGVFGSFSFSMPKVITMGQGGALITDNPVLYEKLRKFKDFGRPENGSDHYEILGYNLKITDLQSVFGLEQFKKLPWRVERKKEIFKKYRALLKEVKEVTFLETSDETSPCFNDIFVENPDELAAFLKEKGIGTRRVYPTLNDLPFYQQVGDFPGSRYISDHGLWLPSSSKLSDQEIEYICSAIKEFYA